MKKTNRTFKRFAAITSASLLAACMVAPMATGMTSSAADTTITIDTEASTSVFTGYQLLSATQNGDKFAYVVNDAYLSALTTVTGESTSAEIVDYIEGLATEAAKQEFAYKVYNEIKKIQDNTGIVITLDKENNYSVTTSQGYYLIAETTKDSTSDTYSLVMLDTAGTDELILTPKETTPTLVKKVKETNDTTGVTSGWQDGADYDVDDTIPFQLTGTVSEKFDFYNEYFYSFHDTMATGLTFDSTSVKVYLNSVATENIIPDTMYDIITTGIDDGCTFEVEFDDLKDYKDAATGDCLINGNSKIIVEYNATLNANAVIGSAGNENKAKLEYSVNPYFKDSDGDGKDDTDNTITEETGSTNEDKVKVYTYSVDIDKVDGNNNALTGAGFTLYKQNPNGTYDAVGDEIVGTAETPISDFTWNRLDAGTYKLVETKIPAGYNQADDLIFTIEATYDTDSATPAFSALTAKDNSGNDITTGDGKIFTATAETGVLSGKVINESGTKLPGTGGIGTTIFYLGGGAMAAIGGVYLISKRRMKKSEE